MATDLLTLIEGADRKFTYPQFRAWVVAQAVRNALETFHGSWAFDPDNPASGEGFISDDQMRALNITIRRAERDAFGHCLHAGLRRERAVSHDNTNLIRRNTR